VNCFALKLFTILLAADVAVEEALLTNVVLSQEAFWKIVDNTIDFMLTELEEVGLLQSLPEKPASHSHSFSETHLPRPEQFRTTEHSAKLQSLPDQPPKHAQWPLAAHLQ